MITTLTGAPRAACAAGLAAAGLALAPRRRRCRPPPTGCRPRTGGGVAEQMARTLADFRERPEAVAAGK